MQKPENGTNIVDGKKKGEERKKRKRKEKER